ncbi:hypothetical protein [Amycolatopsis sp. MtRt-6]|uniref:hypothetical protein n=1 Tax=Amycolatopsis sp. MtRt-6 TaxID=2792782 RepID=UPI001A908FB7|nr:hypothetical protein [Amycolatopsis sp. MtRt-6]
MDLTAWLLGRTPVRPLIATAVGATGVRLAVEGETRRRGWRPALRPAEANLLVVAGADDPAMTPFADAVWQLVPAPRVRIGLTDPAEVAAALSEAEVRLRSRAGQRSSSAGNTAAEHVHHTGGGHSEHMDHGHHHGHDMGGMEMPGGIPMADRAADRDGLKLDRLTVPLGPVLPAWPAGLLVRVRMQGDVVQEATVGTVLTPRHGTRAFWDGEARLRARRLDSCVRLLTVAGWEDAAVVAARLRDDLLAGQDPGSRFTRWANRVRRSRVLRWSLTGVGAQAGSGDGWDRLIRWIDEATNPAETDDPAQILDALPALLAGTDLAAARLVVASFDPDLERLRVSHG